MATSVRGVRARDEEWALFVEAAGLAGLSLNGWLRRAGRDAAALESSLRRRREQELAERERVKSALRGES